MNRQSFSTNLLKWWDKYGRKDMPWQQRADAYKIWVSEVMLQQTQVATVIPYFNRFMQSFPSIDHLADASLDQVLHHWTGLGYYSRARNLHKSAQIIVAEHHGQLPREPEILQQLPGIGRSTAGAIAAQAYHLPVPILDANVKRVLSRVYCVEGWLGSACTQKKLWQHATELTPNKRVRDYTQAIMDLGASLCSRTKPQCPKCPVSKHCQAYSSRRQLLFPQTKPKRKIATKSVAMLIIRSGQQVLLQQRPASGIWGSLYCFPQLECDDGQPPKLAQISDYLHSLELTADKLTTLPMRSHKFSHFELRYTPIVIEVAQLPMAIADADTSLWYNLAQPPQVGLPKPVSELLNNL